MYAKASTKIDQAHSLVKNSGLELRIQNLRGGEKIHKTEFYLYNVDNYALLGDVSIDRAKNVPETSFIEEEDQEV